MSVRRVCFELELPGLLYQMVERRAELMGVSVEEFIEALIVHEVKKELAVDAEISAGK